mgnify:CR=1 FL=1
MEREEKERLIVVFVMGIFGALAGYSLLQETAKLILTI